MNLFHTTLGSSTKVQVNYGTQVEKIESHEYNLLYQQFTYLLHVSFVLSWKATFWCEVRPFVSSLCPVLRSVHWSPLSHVSVDNIHVNSVKKTKSTVISESCLWQGLDCWKHGFYSFFSGVGGPSSDNLSFCFLWRTSGMKNKSDMNTRGPYQSTLLVHGVSWG